MGRHPVLAPIVAVAQELVTFTVQGMEGMHDPEIPFQIVAIMCKRWLSPTGTAPPGPGSVPTPNSGSVDGDLIEPLRIREHL